MFSSASKILQTMFSVQTRQTMKVNFLDKIQFFLSHYYVVIGKIFVFESVWGLVHKALLDVFSHANLSQTCLTQNKVCRKPS